MVVFVFWIVFWCLSGVLWLFVEVFGYWVWRNLNLGFLRRVDFW